MAEGYTGPTSKILCRYFVHGACRQGQNCKFSHNRQDKTDNVCKYYLKGCCTFADKCRYDHVKVKDVRSYTPVKPSQPHVTKPLLKISPEIDQRSNMVSLKKSKSPKKTESSLPMSPEQWVKASEFVPGKPHRCSTVPFSYATAASDPNTDPLTVYPDDLLTSEVTDSSQLLCPFSINRSCPYGEECVYAHGEICDLCGDAVLLANDKQQNEKHLKECMEKHERDMELSFAIARSKDKQCGICMDTVYEKEPPTERRFGIMSDCTHCFCLQCIRKWRASKQFDSKTIRSCPECRTQSDFVTPSQFWVETKEEKIKVIEGYKGALSKKKCKYFDEGRGDCPFNEKCFYLHVNPDGTKATPKPRKPRRRQNAEGMTTYGDRISLWDFLENWQEQVELLLLLEMTDDLMLEDFLSDYDDDDSDFSL